MGSGGATMGSGGAKGNGGATGSGMGGTDGGGSGGGRGGGQGRSSLIVFVSSATYNGNLGGITGADQKCEELATAAGLFPDHGYGQFRAWLSTSTASAAMVLEHPAQSYVLAGDDQPVVSSNWADLIDGTLQRPINRDETGATVGTVMAPVFVWTATLPSGALNSTGNTAENCVDWTISTQTGTTPGNAGAMDSSWTNLPNNFRLCSALSHLYCFEQPMLN